MAGQFFLAAQSRPVYMAFADSRGPRNPTGSAHCAGPRNGSSRHTVVPLCALFNHFNHRMRQLVVHYQAAHSAMLAANLGEGQKWEDRLKDLKDSDVRGPGKEDFYLQEAAIGKALWHQITTVVILRQNMHQKTQTPNDERLCEALSNMRYKACTPDNIAFLHSRISSEIEGWPSVNEKQFRNVSVITTLNLPKDVINDLGSQST